MKARARSTESLSVFLPKGESGERIMKQPTAFYDLLPARTLKPGGRKLKS